MNPEKVNILLVDDHTMVTEGMRSILSGIGFIGTVTSAATTAEALIVLNSQLPHIVFADINLPDNSGIELCAKIKKDFPQVHVIGLSTFRQRSYVSQMIANGASGYLLKSATKQQIEEAIKDVLQGKLYFSPDINNTAVPETDSQNGPSLTRREKEILKLIASGKKSNEIATQLFLSPYTVETHRKNLLTKFNVSNTAQLINKAADFSLL
jgi:two-component system, NarL family, nitrate/nitrite response regulator NarL